MGVGESGRLVNQTGFPRRGEIWLVSLEPVVGSEIGKTRPALVISNNRNNEFSDTITLLPITSKVEKIYPFEALLKQGEGNLTHNSKAKTNQIRTVDKRRLVKRVGIASKEAVKRSEEALLIHLGMA